MHPATPPLTGPAHRFRQLRDDPRLRWAVQVRAQAAAAIRDTLRQHGFVEIDTPLVQPDRTGQRPLPVAAAAAPGRLCLRSSPLYLRGMLAAGFPQVFEFARMFRDEPADGTHQLEYTLVEIYQTGTDYHGMRRLAQQLIAAAVRATLCGSGIRLADGTTVDLTAPWPVRPFYTALSTATGTTLTSASSADQLRAAADRHHLDPGPGTPAEQALTLHDLLVQPATSTPVVYTDFPAAPSPLARPLPHEPALAQKWDLVVGGVEVATGYTEQHELPPAAAAAADGEAQLLDDEWRAVFAGMPSGGGLCIGLDRLVMLLAEAPRVDAALAFPLAGL